LREGHSFSCAIMLHFERLQPLRFSVRPARLPSVKPEQTYFVGTSTWQKRSLFQSTRLAELFCRTLSEYRDNGKFTLQAFVLMPDHFHLLITPAADVTLERCLQLIKGGFSFRVKKELEKNLEIWQRGFTDRRVRDMEEFVGFRNYIHENPVKSRLCAEAKDYPYSSANQRFRLDPVAAYLRG